MARKLIGTSGFSYAHWGNGVFYPPGLPRYRWLEYYAGRFSTVELNVTFYRLPSRESFRSWARRTPPEFRFAVKGSKLITHQLKLEGVDDALARLFDACRGLGDGFGAVLWQLPPRFGLDLARLKSFLSKLPRGVRHAFEFRDRSWLCEPVYELLESAGAALCWADQPGTTPEVVTSDFVYIRRHGPGGGHGSCYGIEHLRELAFRIRECTVRGRDVYVYFNNDVAGYAVKNADELLGLLTSSEEIL